MRKFESWSVWHEPYPNVVHGTFTAKEMGVRHLFFSNIYSLKLTILNHLDSGRITGGVICLALKALILCRLSSDAFLARSITFSYWFSPLKCTSKSAHDSDMLWSILASEKPCKSSASKSGVSVFLKKFDVEFCNRLISFGDGNLRWSRGVESFRRRVEIFRLEPDFESAETEFFMFFRIFFIVIFLVGLIIVLIRRWVLGHLWLAAERSASGRHVLGTGGDFKGLLCPFSENARLRARVNWPRLCPFAKCTFANLTL